MLRVIHNMVQNHLDTPFVTSILSITYGYGDNQDGGIGLRSYPLDYVLHGFFYWLKGRLFYLDNGAFSWSITNGNLNDAHNLNNGGASIRMILGSKNGGEAIRCWWLG